MLTPNNEKLLTVQETADLTGLTPGRIYRLIHADQLRAIRLHGKAWLIPESEARRLSIPSKVGRPRSRKPAQQI